MPPRRSDSSPYIGFTDAKTLFGAPLQIKTTNAPTGGPIDIDIETIIDNRIDSQRGSDTSRQPDVTSRRPCVNARILNNLLVYCVVSPNRCHWYKQRCLML
ncbi:unnamed protein product [Spodoptera littoralis]|uniref:Uncharacterized protein n=1 Tax=Spodoptera littoralis TaxID=7109 RepID=A0A9P0I0H9_SPOLI|nr:unnamed protein product [Spodoptera littoralis]CAH1637181.1 unnamed protein product [Spodoptera littoralis]